MIIITAEAKEREEARLTAEEKARKEAEAALKQDINAAENGDSRAQCAMASRYRDGDGVTASADKAFEWWQKAAAQVNTDAMYAVAQCYENGDGVKRRIDSAKEWYGKLARMGDERGKTALAAIKEREEAAKRAEEERIAAATLSSVENFEYELSSDMKGVRITGAKNVPHESLYSIEDYIGECNKTILGLAIPNEIEGMPVTEIGEEAFIRFLALKRVVLPDTVTRIYDCAFCECKSLTEINMPKALVEIGGTSIRNYKQRWNGEEGVFGRCYSLTSIVLPDTLTEIGDGAFSECISLESIRLPKQLETLGSQVFEYCQSLISIDIPEGTKTIWDGAFYNCTALKAIKLPTSLVEIGSHAFYGCSSLESIDMSGTKVAYLGKLARRSEFEKPTFGECTALKSVSLPPSIIAICGVAFWGCSSLKEVIVPPSVKSIKFESEEYSMYMDTFVGCTSIPLRAQAALKALGYKGDFKGTKNDRY